MTFNQHWAAVRQAADDTLGWYIESLASGHDTLTLSDHQRQFVQQLYEDAWQRYLAAAKQAYDISQRSLNGDYANKQRSPYFNEAVATVYQAIRQTYVDKGFISILGGVTIVNQIGSIKQMYISESESQPVLDVMGSATTLNLGAGFPLFAAIDTIDKLLGIDDNMALVYHASIHQQLCFDVLCDLYPVKSVEPQIFSESSGTAVNSIAIEAASAYAEKLGLKKNSRILAFKGSWSGGFGTAKEASSFGATTQHEKKAGLHWIDRCLEIPQSRSEELRVLAVVEQKVAAGLASGLIFEKIIGDAGIIELSDSFVSELLKLFDNSPHSTLPVIVDEIQAGNGRSSDNYWSFSPESGLTTYERLIITNAKSSAGGKPYAFVLMPKAIAMAAYPLSMLTTHSGNGPVGRAATYAKFVTHPKIQAIKNESAAKIEDELTHSIGQKWRGRHLNIGIITDGSRELELLQHYLYIHNGILAGAFPATLRFQPNLIEYPDTLLNVVKTIGLALTTIKTSKDSPQGNLVAELSNKLAGKGGGGLNI